MSPADTIGILGTDKGPHIRDLQAALESLGCRVLLVDPKRLRACLPENNILYTDSDGSQIRLEELKGLIVRSLPGGSLEQVNYRLNVLHYLEKLGVRIINSASVIEKTVDKCYTTALMARAGLPVPRTVVTERVDQAVEAVENMGSVVVKPIFGSLGKGIVRIEDPETAHRVFRALELGRYVYYVQQYLEGGGEDFRLMVAGGRVIGAMRRRGCNGNWKTNVAYGATPEEYQPEPEMVRLALLAAETLQADYVGVDILVSGKVPYILEANGIPGWSGLQSVSQIDIAKTLAEFFLQRIYQ